MKSEVRGRLRYSAAGRRAAPPVIARLMSVALENPDLLSLAAGFTDTHTLPKEAVRDALDRLLSRKGPPEYLQYGSNQGRPELRGVLAERLTADDSLAEGVLESSRVFITNGSQQALYLAMQILCDPGDIVLVDRPSYFVFLELLSGLGIEARSIPVDAEGRVDEEGFDRLMRSLEREGSLDRVQAAYWVAYFSNPSGRTLRVDEKRTIARVLERWRPGLPLIEDAAYRDLYFEEPDPAPGLFGLAEFADFPRLYLGTLDKPFASGLKVGFGVCSDSEWLARMLHIKGHHDFGSANLNQAILEEALYAGAYDRHLPPLRGAYLEKMRALNDTLETSGLRREGWRWRMPSGGLYLWLEGPRGVDTRLDSPLFERCLGAGVFFVPGDLCFGDQPELNCIRLSYGVLNVDDLKEAGKRLACALLDK